MPLLAQAPDRFRIEPEDRARLHGLERALRGARGEDVKRRLSDLTAELQWKVASNPNIRTGFAVGDPWYFCRTFGVTKDEHAGEDKEVYRQFPDHEYLRLITRHAEIEPMLAIPKSRQVMVSWIIVANILHRAMTRQGQLWIMSSKVEGDASKLVVDRAQGMYLRLPKVIQDMVPMEASVKPPRLKFPTLDSTMEGISQGAHQIRMNVPSGLFMDEAAFQPECASSYEAAQPCLTGGGQLIMASSAAPGFFESVVLDDLGR